MSSKAKKIQKDIESSYQMSKAAQEVYKEALNSLAMIGRCSCRQGLFLDLDSEDPFKYYCFNCNRAWDVRVPCRDHFFYKEEADGQTFTSPLQKAVYLRKKLRNQDITDKIKS